MTENTKTIQPPATRSLVTTLVAAFFFLSAVVLLFSSALQLFTNFQTQQQVIISRQRIIAKDASETVNNFVEDKFSTLEEVIYVANLSAVPDEQKQTILETLLGLQPAFRQAVYVDASRAEIATIARITPRLSPEFRAQFQDVEALFEQIEAGQRYISPIYITEYAGEPLVALAVPVTDAAGNFRGSVVVELNLRFMWDLVDQLEVGQTGVAYVVDDAGQLIAYRDTSLVLSAQNLAHLNTVAEFVAQGEDLTTQAEESPTISTGITGDNVVSLYAPLSTVTWAVVTELPWAEAYADLISLGVWSLVITLGMTILAGLTGFYVARRLAAPIVELSAVATEIGAGNLAVQAEVAGPSETATLAQTFNEMTARMRNLVDSLEQRVADRTKALATSAEVSRRISTILDQGQLLAEVVEQIKSAFDYYHVHIYLYDEDKRNLEMVGGTGDAGQAMLARGHKIEPGSGLVSQAAQTNAIVNIPDVSQADDWLPNPLLPETKAEVAAPIAIGNDVLGVLDVQHDVSEGLTQQDSELIEALASQIALAIQNARAYSQIQSQADREARILAIGQRIQRATSIDDVLKVAVSELGQALATQRANVELGLVGQAIRSSNGGQ